MDSLRNSGALLGRLLLGTIFVVSGIFKLTNPAGTAALMAHQGIPLSGLLVWVTILVEVGGGLALIAGVYGQLAALVLFLFLIPVTLAFHTGPKDQINFSKNLAIMGGLLMVATQGPGGLSVDNRMRRGAAMSRT